MFKSILILVLVLTTHIKTKQVAVSTGYNTTDCQQTYGSYSVAPNYCEMGLSWTTLAILSHENITFYTFFDIDDCIGVANDTMTYEYGKCYK